MGFILGQIEKIYKDVLFRRHDPDGSVFYFSHSDFDGLSNEEFSFVSKRGHRLQGAFYSYDNSKRDRLIVLEHGMGNGHNGYFREIEYLAKQGYLVYSYDHTGCNRSEGEHIYGLSGSLSDLDDCITALVNERGYSEEQISVVGHSWGGFSSLNILSYHPKLHSVVALSGFISIPVMQKEAIPAVFAPFRKALFQLERRTNPVFADANATDTLLNIERPVLIIHAEDDKTVSHKLNFCVLKKALSHKPDIRFISVSGSGHNPTYTAEAYKYKEAFFAKLKIERRKGRINTPEQKSAFIKSFDWYKMTEQNEEVWNKIISFLEK